MLDLAPDVELIAAEWISPAAAGAQTGLQLGCHCNSLSGNNRNHMLFDFDKSSDDRSHLSNLKKT